MADLEDVINSLRNTKLTAKGISFQGQSLKLDTVEDAQVVVAAINNCKDLEFLNLEGNTLGVEAAAAIAEALKYQPKFKRALWKDMFTGRMKTEIPQALEYLGLGLVAAATQLTELDLSDNAFGPTGVNGLAFFLKSSSCYTLEELRLNNNGLGIIGGKLLAQALLHCFNSSKALGKPLALRVFVAGRNRLENDGAKALAEVFKTLGSLEEVVMPQNGIYHIGISALSTAFQHNKNLQILNLNDNTIGPKGAAAISKVLPNLPKLKYINFGDCLLKTKGASLLADGLKDTNELEELILGFNEMQIGGALTLIDAILDKKNLRSLILDGNQFGETGKKQIEMKLKEIGKYNILGSLAECESEDEKEDSVESEEESLDETQFANLSIVECSFGDFIKDPSPEKFLGLGHDRDSVILTEIQKSSGCFLDTILPTLMKISALTVNAQEEVARCALNCSKMLYSRLFFWTQSNNALILTNNALMVHLGLIKCEDKKFKPSWDIKGCLLALESIVGQYYVVESTKHTLRAFLIKDLNEHEELIESKQRLIKLLG